MLHSNGSQSSLYESLTRKKEEKKEGKEGREVLAPAMLRGKLHELKNSNSELGLQIVVERDLSSRRVTYCSTQWPEIDRSNPVRDI